MKLEEIFSFDHLYQSHKNCRRSKQHKGEVIRFEANLSYNLIKIQRELFTKKYQLGGYKSFFIYEPKERLIEAPTYKDRVVIRCFCDYSLKPKIEERLIYDNAACRKNKGTDFSIQRLYQFLRHEYQKEKNNHIYYLKCDIKKYFPSINHQILIKRLSKLNFSEEELWLIKKIINEQKDYRMKGLPLGNQTSQWFALYYLDMIDRLIKEKLGVKSYVRYMDDMILISRDKQFLRKCKQEIEYHCFHDLDLELNHKTQIGKVKNGIDYLGYRHILTDTGKIIRKLRSTSKIRLKKHIKTLSKLEKKQIVDQEYIFQRKNAYYQHLKYTVESNRIKNEVNPWLYHCKQMSKKHQKM